MHVDIQPFAEYAVAPYVGAWIETVKFPHLMVIQHLSHPTWVRGLKLLCAQTVQEILEVAPYVGAWIETPPALNLNGIAQCRTLRGCVD